MKWFNLIVFYQVLKQSVWPNGTGRKESFQSFTLFSQQSENQRPFFNSPSVVCFIVVSVKATSISAAYLEVQINLSGFLVA